MTFRIIESLTEGLHRGASRAGALLVGALFALWLLEAVTLEISGFIVQEPLVSIPLGLEYGLLVVSYLAFMYIIIVAYRTFAAGRTDSIPREASHRRIGACLLSLLGGGIAFAFLVIGGLLLLILPGLFLLVSLWFFDVAIAVEDVGATEGLDRRFELTRGHRLPLFGLGLIVSIGAISINALSISVGWAIGGVLGEVIVTLAISVTNILVFAITVTAYEQLREDHESEAEEPQPATDTGVAA